MMTEELMDQYKKVREEEGIDGGDVVDSVL